MTSIVDDRGFNQGYSWTPAQALRMRRRAKAIVDAVRPGPGGRLLELGCGTGELASLLAEEGPAGVTGVDLCAPFIDEARRRFGNDRVSFEVADLAQPAEIERLGSTWSAVVGNGILHHLYYVIDEALPLLRRLVAPGGKFVFWEPNYFNPYIMAIFTVPALRKVTRLEPAEMAFTPRWIRARLERAGFTDVQVTFRDFLLPNLPPVLVPLVTRAGDLAERLPLVDHLAQSLFIVASVPADATGEPRPRAGAGR